MPVQGNSSAGAIRVIVVDDSAVMRRLLSELLNALDGVEVVGSAADGEAAIELIALVKPDVVTLDVAMPRMDGLEVLERLMKGNPVPVVMVSAFTERASETTMRALELGAVDCIGKPVRDIGGSSFGEYSQELGEKIRAAKAARIRPSVARFPALVDTTNKRRPVASSASASSSSPSVAAPSAVSVARELVSRSASAADVSAAVAGLAARRVERSAVAVPVPVTPAPAVAFRGRPAAPPVTPSAVETAPVRSASSGAPRKVICIGASTGGTEALKQLLLGFPADCPPTLIVQHMPEAFTGSFARRLDGMCAPTILEAKGGETLQHGVVYIAPGHSHMRVKRVGSGWATELSDAPPVNRHRPSVDVLFDSAAEFIGSSAVGVILTGMGRDGAQGLLRMRQARAMTYGQDEATCVVYGMPREAALLGAVAEVVSIDDMAKQIFSGLAKA